MKKSILFASFVIIFGVMAFANISASAYTYGDLTYEITDGEVIITDCKKSVAGEIVIPKSIDGYAVTKIGRTAFENCTSITDVYYNGAEEMWNAIEIGEDNEYLTNAKIYFKDSYFRGDANGDEVIDIEDVVLMRRFITGGQAETIFEGASDVNKDGEVDVRDVVVLRRYLAGGYGIELTEQSSGIRFEVVDVPDSLRDENVGEEVKDIIILRPEEDGSIYFPIDGILNGDILDGDAFIYWDENESLPEKISPSEWEYSIWQ